MSGTLEYEWPDTEHPAYATQANGIRQLLDRNAIQVPRVPASSYEWIPDGQDEPAPTRILTIRKAYGTAPYVGRPFVYIWRVAVDEQGRWVAGPAEIQHLCSEFEWESGLYHFL